MLRLLLALTLATAPAPSPTWDWPLAPRRVVIRPFVAPVDRYSAGHRGIDLFASLGTDVLSPAYGVVYFAGVVVDRPVLTIRHTGGVLSSFEPVASTLAVGDPVARGEPVGTVEPGSHCPSSCLHFGVRIDGEYVSPFRLLGGIPRAVLLPVGR